MKKLFFVVAVFLIVGAGMIAFNRGTDFTEKGDTKAFLDAFGSWLRQVGKSSVNVAGAAVGAALRQDWFPGNATAMPADAVNKTTQLIEVVEG